MPVPVILATAAATGSIITSIKSGWELRRMIKKKQEQLEAAEEAPYIFRKLRRAHEKGLLNNAEYDHWYEKFLVAKVERDLPAMQRIRAHLRLVERGHTGSVSRSASVASPRSHRESGFASHNKRRLSISVPQANERRARDHVEWPASAGSIEYFPDRNAKVGARPDEFIRLERQVTPAYGPSSRSSTSASSDSDGSRRKRSPSVRFESPHRPRGRY